MLSDKDLVLVILLPMFLFALMFAIVQFFINEILPKWYIDV